VTANGSLRILVVGDSFAPMSVFASAFAGLARRNEISYRQLDPTRTFEPRTASGRSIREYEGSPDQIMEWIDGYDVLVVHAGAVTDAVVDRSQRLKLICCARGGPVNVDVAAATARGIPLVTTPGKNADSVADLTLAFIIMLERRIASAQRQVELGGPLGVSTFEGAAFLGHDLIGRTLGLVGFGQVGRRVARRAVAFGMKVLVYDPFVEVAQVAADGAEGRDLADLMERSDVVSLHARSSPSNARMFGAPQFSAMRAGALFVNTARETLVDEDALAAALASGHLGGAALDIVDPRPDGSRHPLLAYPNVIITPHIGGATHETLSRGASMIATEIARFANGEPLRNVADRAAVKGGSAPRS
jgi:D-3-phosphoglycerate dehydrogenase / 2-oxoglutarate reductase